MATFALVALFQSKISLATLMRPTSEFRGSPNPDGAMLGNGAEAAQKTWKAEEARPGENKKGCPVAKRLERNAR
jgi:hypothetical protein